MKVRGQDPSSADHIFTLISSPPERTTTPDGKNLQLSTHPMWPSSTRCKKILHHWHKRMLNYIPWYLQYPHPIPIAFLLQMNTLLDHHLIYPYTTTKEKINIKNSDCTSIFNYHIQCIRSVQGEGAFQVLTRLLLTPPCYCCATNSTQNTHRLLWCRLGKWSTTNGLWRVTCFKLVAQQSGGVLWGLGSHGAL